MPRAPVRRREGGATAVVVALVLVAIGGFVALVINVGHLMMARGQLQNACDAAALAGAEELDGSEDGLWRARGAAVDFARRHSTDRGMAVELDPDADVVFGRWDWSQPKPSAFTPISEAAPGAAELINAVQVLAGREERRGNPLEVFLGGFGAESDTASVTAEAVAVKGGPCEQACAVPLALAECQVMVAGRLDCGQTLVFQNDTEDNVGFTNLLDGVRSVNTHDIIEMLEGECRGVATHDVIGISNGNNLNKNVVTAFEGHLERTGSQQVTVPIVRPPGGCPAKFNGMMEVVGFATFTIRQIVGPPHPAIHIQLDCQQTADEGGRSGCGFFGTVAPKPTLVR